MNKPGSAVQGPIFLPNIFFLKQILLVLLITISSVACERGASEAKVEKVSNQFFEELKNGHLDQALDLCSDDFFVVRSRQQWLDYLKMVRETIGSMQSYTLSKKQSDSRFSGRFYLYHYRNLYAREPAWEVLTLLSPVDSDEIKIIGYKIKAKGLKQ
jgi:hypothetical protein